MTETNAERFNQADELLTTVVEMGDGHGKHKEGIEVLKWLIDQAERVQELEEEEVNLTNLLIESERDYYLLREALKQIVNIDSYFMHRMEEFNPMKAYELVDEIARKTLEETQ